MNECTHKNISWDQEVLFHTGEDFYNDIIKSIRLAKESIYIEAHYFDEKYLGRKVTKELLKALGRNITVYLVLDGMSPLSRKKSLLRRTLKLHGAHIRIFNPMPWHSFSLFHLFKVNQRTHKKLILIDQMSAYIGSYNIDTRQLRYAKGSENWSDCGVLIQGPEVTKIIAGFWDAWNFCKYPKRKLKSFNPEANSIVRLNHHKSWRNFYLDDIIERINRAKDNIWITNPYFVPDSRMKDALLLAHQRGVDVTIIIPQKSDLKLFPLINFIFFKSLLYKGVKVFEYLPSILHTKNIIIDNWIILGSSNLNSRSQKHDWELDIVLSHKTSIKELKHRFRSDLSQSKHINQTVTFKKFGFKSLASPLIVGSKYFL